MEAIMRRCDHDGDGKLSLSDFEKVMNRTHTERNSSQNTEFEKPHTLYESPSRIRIDSYLVPETVKNERKGVINKEISKMTKSFKSRQIAMR